MDRPMAIILPVIIEYYLSIGKFAHTIGAKRFTVCSRPIRTSEDRLLKRLVVCQYIFFLLWMFSHCIPSKLVLNRSRSHSAESFFFRLYVYLFLRCRSNGFLQICESENLHSHLGIFYRMIRLIFLFHSALP